MRKRPFAITFVGWTFIAVGTVMLVVRGRESVRAFHPEDPWILLVEALAIVAGAFMLRGDRWARWLAVVWMVFHVVVGYLNGPQQVLVHAIIFAGITFLLFRADARVWFGSGVATGH